MSEIQHLDTKQGRRIAYAKTEGQGPTILFLSGLKSDMEGTKLLRLRHGRKSKAGPSCALTTRATASARANLPRAPLAIGTKTRWQLSTI